MSINVQKLNADDKLSKHARDNDYLRELSPRQKQKRQSLREPISFLVKQGHLNTDHERRHSSIN